MQRDARGQVVDWVAPSNVVWFGEIYPTLRDDERPYIECIQEPGEIIYVPCKKIYISIELWLIFSFSFFVFSFLFFLYVCVCVCV